MVLDLVVHPVQLGPVVLDCVARDLQALEVQLDRPELHQANPEDNLEALFHKLLLKVRNILDFFNIV